MSNIPTSGVDSQAAAAQARIASTTPGGAPLGGLQQILAGLNGSGGSVTKQQEAATFQQWASLAPEIQAEIWAQFTADTGFQQQGDTSQRPPTSASNLAGYIQATVPFYATDPAQVDTTHAWQGMLGQPIDTSSLGNGTVGFGGVTGGGPPSQQFNTPGAQYRAAIKADPASGPWMNAIVFYAGKAGIPWQVLYGVISATSHFDPNASSGTGVGIAGITPDTGIIPTTTAQANDPNYALQWAAQQLAGGYARFHDWGLSLIAYHQGTATADYLLQNGRPAAGTAAESNGFLTKAFSQLGNLGLDTSTPDFMTTKTALGTGTQTIALPDQATLRDTIVQKFKSTFFRAPSEQEIQQFMGVANTAITQSQTNTPNPYAQAGNPNAPGGAQGQGGSPNIISAAQHYYGTPYQWGGNTAQGLDCSGLTQQVFKQFGINLPRVAAAQMQDRAGQPIADVSQAMPGDLIFFGDPANPHHVGIYAGNGQMIDAPQTGSTVGLHNIKGYGNIAGIRRFAVAGSSAVPSGANVTFAKDPSGVASIDQAMQGTDLYNQLYSHMPGYMTPSAYANEFTAAGKVGRLNPSDLGVTGGLSTGDPNVTQQIASEQAVAAGDTMQLGDEWSKTALLLSRLV